MTDLTLKEIKNIKAELKALEPAKVRLDGNRKLNCLEAIMALYPALERMQKRGFTIDEVLEKLREKGIEVAPSTYQKYMGKCRKNKLREAQVNAAKKEKVMEPVNTFVADLQDAVIPTQPMPEKIAEKQEVQKVQAVPATPLNSGPVEEKSVEEPVPKLPERQKQPEELQKPQKMGFVIHKSHGDINSMVFGNKAKDGII